MLRQNWKGHENLDGRCCFRARGRHALSQPSLIGSRRLEQASPLEHLHTDNRHGTERNQINRVEDHAGEELPWDSRAPIHKLCPVIGSL